MTEEESNASSVSRSDIGSIGSPGFKVLASPISYKFSPMFNLDLKSKTHMINARILDRRINPAS
jgi:hypothetical protein